MTVAYGGNIEASVEGSLSIELKYPGVWGKALVLS